MCKGRNADVSVHRRLVWPRRACGGCRAQPASAQTVLFEDARLIPGDGSAALESSAVLVERGIITRIGRSGEIAAPAGATRIDLAARP